MLSVSFIKKKVTKPLSFNDFWWKIRTLYSALKKVNFKYVVHNQYYLTLFAVDVEFI